MVIFFEWYRTAEDQRSSSGLPMTGEDTGLGALASPLVGYLGKVQERASSLEYCPWCTSKGSTYALRSYRINLQESVTLCTNPQCLFPLVSRSLEDVLASLDPVGNKRKNALTVEKEELIRPVHKRLRSGELESLGPQCITGTHISQAEHGAVNVVSNGHHAAPKTDDGKVNGYGDSPVAETTGQESLQYDVLDKEPENAACAGGIALLKCVTPVEHVQCSSEALLTTDGGEPALSGRASEADDDFRRVKSPSAESNGRCSLDSSQSFFTNEDIHSPETDTPSPPHSDQAARTERESLNADITACKDKGRIKTETEDMSSTTTIMESEELVSAPNWLFWRNSDNLCWLDSLLVALVNCKSLRKRKPKDEPQRSAVWQLMRRYEDVCTAVQAHHQTGKDGVVRVPRHVLQEADAHLQRLRMSVFEVLQPKLHCKLGRRETPVFAMPPLLQMDSWVEPLFQSTFHWEFKCSECKTATKERVMKTLPTFTNVLPDWCPLNAVHLAPCNVCCQKNQRRTMMLESLPPVFELHFVEGLPDNDVSIYTFTFKGKRYSITTIIQYNQKLKHFVTWICNPDGSWLEYDDLKHPDCKTHRELPVPAREMHVVFWEVEEDEEPRACSPTSTFAQSPSSKTEVSPGGGDKDLTAGDLLACTPDQSLLASHNDTDIVCALSVSEDSSNATDTTISAGVDTSIGSTTLLDTFEGLSHNDIITLTLVELNVDSEMQMPLNDNEQTEDLSVPSMIETLDSTPDSSSAVTGSEMSPGPETEIPTTSTSSESADDSSNDPTYVPDGKRGAKRSRRVSKVVKKAAATKAVPLISPLASSEHSKEISRKCVAAAAAQDETPPVETTPQASHVSSTDTSPLPTSQTSPTMPPQHARWSFLLSKHPLNQVHKSIAQVPPTHTPIPTPQVKPPPPTHSTPNSVRRLQAPGGLFHKPQLRTEEIDSLPLKAAEMYGGFSARSSNTPNPIPSPALLTGKLFQPVTSNHQKSLTNTTVVSGTSLPALGAKRLPDISSSNKHGSRSSKLPQGLSDTEALRYKLMKKLKAKKKKLAKLNQLLGHQGGASLQPDSTDLGSPNTVTSSTYDGSITDLLSPATTASNLSPDSTGYLEMLANRQDGVNQLDCDVSAFGAVSQDENFLDEFLSQAVAERPTEMETEALNALELFI